MSDIPAVSPNSSSPGRHSAFVRPPRPWASQRPSSAGSLSATSHASPWFNASQAGDGASTSPFPGARRPHNSSTSGSLANLRFRDDTFREWSFNSFEWTVRDVSNLSASVADNSTPDLESFELLRDSPIIGDGKYMVEVAHIPAEAKSGSAPQELSLSITSLVLDFAHADFEISASMMAAIKCLDGSTGERGSKVEWIWEMWDKGFVFRQGSEVWRCSLPNLTELLVNESIARADAFILCVQIHSPIGPFFPNHPTTRYVPRELVLGLEASLDNPNTGDVRFVCLERRLPGSTSPSETVTTRSVRSSSSGSAVYSQPHVALRKRVIWAHRDVLIRRSEYFATMLDSSFSEANATSGERQVYTIMVEQADFSTIYWLLKWIYANWILFDDDYDLRNAVDGVSENWHSHWSSGQPNEWGWKIDSPHGYIDEEPSVVREDEASSVGSATSHQSEKCPPSKGKQPYIPSSTPVGLIYAHTRGQGLRLSTSSTYNQATIASSRHSTHETKVASSGGEVSNSSGATKSSSTTNNRGNAPQSHYTLSPRQSRYLHGALDPHPHPTPEPSPASALAIYQISHRYGLLELQNLALEHMINGLTVDNSFPLLLSSHLWEELRDLVEDYIVSHWDAVSNSSLFNRSCQEVALGEWGSEGGNTLVALFRRLRSPSQSRG